MNIAIDTNRLTDLFQGDSQLATELGGCDRVLVAFVLAEMKAGFLGGTRQARNELLLHRFLMKPTVEVVAPGRETMEYYARCSPS